MPHVLIVDPADSVPPTWSRLLEAIAEVTIHQVSSPGDAAQSLLSRPAAIVFSLPSGPAADGEFEFWNGGELAAPIVVVAREPIAPSQVLSLARAFAVIDHLEVETRLAETVQGALEESRRRREAAAISAGLTRTVLQYELGSDKTRISAFASRLLQECDRHGLFDERDRFRTQIALEEALLNATVHGNLEVSSRLREENHDAFSEMIALRQSLPEYAARRIYVTFDADRSGARFVIRDEGPGFDVSRLPDPRDSDRLELASGRGVLLMRTFMDEVAYNATGNEVRMLKRRSQSFCGPETAAVSSACHTTCAAAG